MLFLCTSLLNIKSSININPLIEDRGSEVVADSDQSLEKLK